MIRASRSISVLAAIVLVAGACLAHAASGSKAYTLHGKVEAVEKSAGSLKVRSEKVEGWMDAMTMSFKVDDPSILDTVKAGDEIVATVYNGDYSLHKVHVMKKSAGDPRPKQ
jgi:protein SCO1